MRQPHVLLRYNNRKEAKRRVNYVEVVSTLGELGYNNMYAPLLPFSFQASDLGLAPYLRLAHFVLLRHSDYTAY